MFFGVGVIFECVIFGVCVIAPNTNQLQMYADIIIYCQWCEVRSLTMFTLSRESADTAEYELTADERRCTTILLCLCSSVFICSHLRFHHCLQFALQFKPEHERGGGQTAVIGIVVPAPTMRTSITGCRRS